MANIPAEPSSTDGLGPENCVESAIREDGEV